jgi:glycosyltransferase involved in cell wall biosynthesis
MFELREEDRPPADGRSLSIAFVSSCPPRQCGIATFTSDLARAVKAADPSVRISWAAINEAGSVNPYGPEVRWRIRQRQGASYREAAEQINASRVDVVSIQHEFGLYGIWGETFEDHLAEFLETLRKPAVTTLHSVIPNPSPSVRDAVRLIGRRSHIVVAMAELACHLLVDQYGLDADKVRVVPHGVPPIEPRGRTRMKKQLGFDGRTIISTFGLVDTRKGLEYMIRAMEAVVERHPDALYLIVGKTHPELVRRSGEAYRNELYELVEARGLDRHVAFVDQYLTQRQIVEYLLASDVYVTPYLDPNQITSGTLSYALGAGKAIVSTRYLHATEALAEGRGILVDFRSEEQLADAVLRILGDPAFKQQLERNAYAYGHEMAWPNIGRRMLGLFRAAAATGPAADLRPVAPAALGHPPRRPAVAGVGNGHAPAEREPAAAGAADSRRQVAAGIGADPAP